MQIVVPVVEKALREKVSHETYVTEAVLKDMSKQLPVYVNTTTSADIGKRVYRRMSEGGARTEVGTFIIENYEQCIDEDWCFQGYLVLSANMQIGVDHKPTFKVLYEKCAMDKSYAVSKIYGIEAIFN